MIEQVQNENSRKRIILDEIETINTLNNKDMINKVKQMNQMDNLLTKIQHTTLEINQLDYYANTIPLGSFCFAISFILYGFYECGVHKKEDPILYTTILLFGGVGQVTAGIFEYIKCRTFLSSLYLTYGLFFLSFFYLEYHKKTLFNIYCQSIFYGTWACITFPIHIASLKINIFFSIQNMMSVGYMVIKCIGLNREMKLLNGIIPGILELISGFCSLYICLGQILNEHLKYQVFPAIPFNKDNGIDNFDK